MVSEAMAVSPDGTGHVSVLIATHRRPDLLRAAINSAQQQSERPLEIIVADDGGTLPPDFADGDCDAVVPVRYLRLAKTGMCGARRAAYAQSRGDFLLFLDDDDTLVPDAIKTLRVLFERHPDAVVATGSAALTNLEGQLTGSTKAPPDEITQERLWFENQMVNAGTALIRRTAYQQIGGWSVDAPNASDYLLWLQLIQVGRIVCTSEIVLHYRWHATNETIRGNQFLHFVAFRRALRAAIPSVAHTEHEDSIMTSLVRNHSADTYWHFRELIRRNEWAEALRRTRRLASATLAAMLRRQTRRALIGTFVQLKPKWFRAGRSLIR
jgi:glycosyltransferase involved in cell wall biosynthesis